MTGWGGDEDKTAGRFKFKFKFKFKTEWPADCSMGARGADGWLFAIQSGFLARKERLKTPTCLLSRVPMIFVISILLFGPTCSKADLKRLISTASHGLRPPFASEAAVAARAWEASSMCFPRTCWDKNVLEGKRMGQ